MFHSQLDTFMAVANAGSFSKAAAELYITPSAVIQQINTLESNIQVTLFVRSRRGLTLTPAGQYLYSQVPGMKEANRLLQQELLRIQAQGQNQIRVGVPRFWKNVLFHELWRDYVNTHPQVQTRITFADMSNQDEKFAESVYTSVDLMEHMKDDSPWQENMSFFLCAMVPIAFLVPEGHPLAEKNWLTAQDLSGETLILARTGREALQEQLRTKAIEYGMKVEETEGFSYALLDSSLIHGTLLVVPAFYENVHPAMKTILCDWDISVPYGFFYQKEPKKEVRDFLQYIEETRT
jgi:DNA-binding transcriptional LysR family regulator